MKRRHCWVALLTGLCLLACEKEPLPEPDYPPPPDPIPAPAEPEWFEQTDNATPAKGVALLDMTARNNEIENGSETGRNLYSADYMLELAGVPFFTTADPTEAMSRGAMILFSSPVRSATFTPQEWASLAEWVRGGGRIVAPALVEVTPEVSALFGVSGSAYGKSRYGIVWNEGQLARKELEYMDEAEERHISIGRGRSGRGEAIKSYAYALSGGEELAAFDSGGTAVTSNPCGLGCTYSFGVLWRDVIQRPQLNKDFEAQRSYSNDFEPSADAFPLFIRSAYAAMQPLAVWKFTVPGGYQALLIPTHDCDSQTAYDQMHHMSDYERRLGLKGHYFLTVHYFRDPPYLSAFYNEGSVESARGLLRDGHTVGSHSIGHFPDFSVTARFPLTEVSREEYRPHHDRSSGITEGGSTWAEVVLSKRILEADLGNRVRSFRTGHLVMNKNIPQALLEGGYSFSSCYSAGDVLGAFPFLERLGNDWTGELSTVLQMPLHLSDVMKDDPIDERNWEQKPARWLQVIDKLRGNYAPAILLIHPNREWKMRAQQMLVEMLDRSVVGLCNFEDYGDFWLRRRSMRFSFAYLPEQGKVIVYCDRATIARCRNHTLAIETAPDTELREVVMSDENRMGYRMAMRQIAPGRYLALVQ